MQKFLSIERKETQFGIRNDGIAPARGTDRSAQ